MTDLIFIDTETTGFEPSKHEIVEIAAIRVTDKFEVLESFSGRVKPTHIETAHPKALEINGYNEEGWKNAMDLDEAINRLTILLTNATPAGHNIAFDMRFIDYSFEKLGVKKPKMDYHTLDTINLAWPLKAAGFVSSLSLTPLCEFMGIPIVSHTALGDALASLEVAKVLIPKFASAMKLNEETYFSQMKECKKALNVLLSRLKENS